MGVADFARVRSKFRRSSFEHGRTFVEVGAFGQFVVEAEANGTGRGHRELNPLFQIKKSQKSG
jgi:hypothetical protein